jgi:hypothetical protein
MDRDLLVENLRRNVLWVDFRKTNGDLRSMRCTLMNDILPEYEKSENPKTPNYDVLPVWDLEKEAWRSFRVENVISFRVA